MRLDTLFRLSTYLTLAVASLGLAYAVGAFIPGFLAFGIAMTLVLAVAFAVEGRWALSPGASNVVALLIAVGSALWMAYHFVHLPEMLGEIVPGPGAMLPYMGPVLMVVLMAKLFRPKQVTDFWWIHGIGLMEVALSCILTGEFLFSAFLVIYLVCALWSLALFHVYREQEAAGQATTSAPASILRASRWAGLVVLGGMALFLLTPQPGDRDWSTYALARHKDPQSMTTGFSGEIDLNRTGKLELSHEEAMEVYAETVDHQPKLDLDPDKRWRGATLSYYDNGRWSLGAFGASAFVGKLDSFQQPLYTILPLPNLGPDEYFLSFTVDPRQAGGLFLADPVVLDPGGNLRPVISLSGDSHNLLQIFPEGGVLLSTVYPRPGKWRYQQVTTALREPDVNPAPVRALNEARLLKQPVEEIRPWTKDLLKRLVAEGKLKAKDLAPDPEAVLPENREKVARALAEHLTSSGEFKYTLDLWRQDIGLDPTADFLLNVKQGHCERFATGLALMLRSCGIPCRVVVGFRGAEDAGNGQYVIRQDQAHSWVEVLIQRPGVGGGKERHWLTLDPSPPEGDLANTEFSWAGWWQALNYSARDFWRNCVLEYNTDKQGDLANSLGRRLKASVAQDTLGGWLQWKAFSPPFWARSWPWIAGPALVLGFITWLARRIRGRRALPVAPGSFPDSGFYARMLGVLARYCRLRPRPSETPREFGEAATQRLAGAPLTGSLAGVPRQVVCLYYRVRYGCQTVGDPEHVDIQRRITLMEDALAAETQGKPVPRK